jgi:hypothetical protein
VNKEKNMNKTKKILKHLKSGKTLTQVQAYRLFNTIRLGAIIFSIRGRFGSDCITTINAPCKDGIKKFAKYKWNKDFK